MSAGMRPTADILTEYMPTIVNGVALSATLMKAAKESGNEDAVAIYRDWIGEMAHLVRTFDLRDVYDAAYQQLVTTEEFGG